MSYMEDAQGRLVPVGMVKDVDKARDDLVREWLGKAQALNAQMRNFLDDALGETAAFVSLSAEQYGARWGEPRGT